MKYKKTMLNKRIITKKSIKKSSHELMQQKRLNARLFTNNPLLSPYTWDIIEILKIISEFSYKDPLDWEQLCLDWTDKMDDIPQEEPKIDLLMNNFAENETLDSVHSTENDNNKHENFDYDPFEEDYCDEDDSDYFNAYLDELNHDYLYKDDFDYFDELNSDPNNLERDEVDDVYKVDNVYKANNVDEPFKYDKEHLLFLRKTMQEDFIWEKIKEEIDLTESLVPIPSKINKKGAPIVLNIQLQNEKETPIVLTIQSQEKEQISEEKSIILQIEQENKNNTIEETPIMLEEGLNLFHENRHKEEFFIRLKLHKKMREYRFQNLMEKYFTNE